MPVSSQMPAAADGRSSARLLLAFAAAIVATAAALPMVTFRAGQDQIVRFRRDRIPVYDAGAVPRFVASQAYVLGAAANPSGRVYAWDQTRALVQVAAPGVPSLWLACRDLAPMAIACATSIRPDAAGAIEVGAVGRDRALAPGALSARFLSALPNCPGDPRCPTAR